MRKIIKSVIGILLLVSMLTGCSEVASSSDSETKKVETGSSETAVSETEKVALHELGEAVTLGDWSITATKHEFVDKIESSKYTAFAPEEGSQYCVAYVSIVNNGTSADSFMPSFSMGDDVSVDLYYADEYKYSSTILLGWDSDLHDKHLNPLESFDGATVFSLPNTVINGPETLTLTFKAGKESISYKIPRS